MRRQPIWDRTTIAGRVSSVLFLSGNAGTPIFDFRHRLVFSYIYDLPIGHGKRFGGGLTGAADKISCWQIAVSPLWLQETGTRSATATATSPTLMALNGPTWCRGKIRMAIIAFPEHFLIPAHSRTSQQCSGIRLFWFWECWTQYVRAPGLQQWDFSIFKIIQTSENTHFRI